jgi:hypothetical protein
MTLVFVESMDPTTLKVEQITLQKSSNAGIAEAHTLSASDFTTAVVGVENMVKLNIVDLNEMKAKGIGLTKVASYLTMTAEAVKDMADKHIEALPSSKPQWSSCKTATKPAKTDHAHSASTTSSSWQPALLISTRAAPGALVAALVSIKLRHAALLWGKRPGRILCALIARLAMLASNCRRTALGKLLPGAERAKPTA